MLTNCFICGEASGVALMGVINTKTRKALAEAGAEVVNGEAPRKGVVLDKEPCDTCKGYMEKGVILISVDEARSDDMENPYRTGEWCVMSVDYIERVFQPPELVEQVLAKRMAWVPDDAWEMLGLPRGGE